MFSFRLMVSHLARIQRRRTTKAMRFQLCDLGFYQQPADLLGMVLHRRESDEFIVVACLAIQQIGE